jgi:hypothetical protein
MTNLLLPWRGVNVNLPGPLSQEWLHTGMPRREPRMRRGSRRVTIVGDACINRRCVTLAFNLHGRHA